MMNLPFISFIRYLGLLLLVLIAACAPVPPKLSPAVEQQWLHHQQQMQRLKQWQINGRMAIVSGEEAWNANVRWLQNAEDYQIYLNTPTGQGAILLEGSAQEVTLTTANHETYRAEDPDKLIAQALNVPLPVSGLYYWIRGLSDESPIWDWEVHNNGYLKRLVQQGWNISFDNYQVVAGFSVPMRIFMNNDDLKVKVAISQWQPKP